MNTSWRVAIVVVLAGAVAAVVAMKAAPHPATGPATAPTATATAPAKALPRLVELGSVGCKACRQMAPIIEGLRAEQAGRLEVEFIDVRVKTAAVETYNIRIIPTQVFLDASGRELWRHEGFLPMEDILAKWKELGVDLSAPGR